MQYLFDALTENANGHIHSYAYRDDGWRFDDDDDDDDELITENVVTPGTLPLEILTDEEFEGWLDDEFDDEDELFEALLSFIKYRYKLLLFVAIADNDVICSYNVISFSIYCSGECGAYCALSIEFCFTNLINVFVADFNPLGVNSIIDDCLSFACNSACSNNESFFLLDGTNTNSFSSSLICTPFLRFLVLLLLLPFCSS